MIQASRSPSSPPAAISRTLTAGPLAVQLVAPSGPLLALIDSTLSLFDVPWTLSPMRRVELACEIGVETALPAEGRYLQCAQMLVDTLPRGLRATTARGASLVGRLDAEGERWHLIVPPDIVDHGLWPEIEDLLSLVLTTGWRRAGWVPLHSAAVTDGERGVLVCAAAGGGKTSFTLALVRRGWQALGDDKLLLRTDGERPEVAAIKHMLNVDPAATRWFPELGDLSSLPEYSTWTPKRRVALGRFWPTAPAFTTAPRFMVVLVRQPGTGALSVEEIGVRESIGALLRQTVIPADPDLARWITGSLVSLAQRLTAYRVVVRDDAYADPSALDNVDWMLH